MNELIEGLYEASILGDKWGDLLGKFGQHFGARGGGLFAVVSGKVFGKFGGEFAQLNEEVFPNYEMTEKSRGVRLMNHDYAGFTTELDIMSYEELMSDEVYRHVLLPRNCVAAVGTKIAGIGDDTLAFAVEGFNSVEAARAVIPKLDELRPHIARATALSARLDLERAKNVTTALDAIGVAAAIINYGGRLKSANSTFGGLLGRSILDFANGIQLAEKAANELLQKTLNEIAISPNFARSIPIRSVAQNDSMVLHIVPLIGAAHDFFSGGNIILFANKAKNNNAPEVSQIKALFDLTATESKIARLIALGKSSGEIASQENKSIHTIRTQIKSILAKTGFNSQKELLALLKDLT